jgi:hypothetical protein
MLKERLRGQRKQRETLSPKGFLGKPGRMNAFVTKGQEAKMEGLYEKENRDVANNSQRHGKRLGR